MDLFLALKVQLELATLLHLESIPSGKLNVQGCCVKGKAVRRKQLTTLI